MEFMNFLSEEYETELWENISELDESEIEELMEFSNLFESEELTEKLSIIARKKMGMLMKKNAKKIQKAKARKELKGATQDDLKRRARKAAVNIIKKKLTNGKTDLSNAEKEKIETKISKLGGLVNKIAKRQFKEVKKKESQKRKDRSQGIHSNTSDEQTKEVE